MRTLVTQRNKLTCYAGQDYGELFNLQAAPMSFRICGAAWSGIQHAMGCSASCCTRIQGRPLESPTVSESPGWERVGPALPGRILERVHIIGEV